jgi:hypothetical protein
MAKNTIKIKKYLDIIEEYVANAAITPGHLIELMSTGKVRVHATEGGNVLPMFALESELEGEGITDAYAADDQVQCWIPTRGDQVYALLANGENVVIGDLLSSKGDGTLKKYVAQIDSASDTETILPEPIVAVALEAVDMSGSSGVDPTGRIEVRIY